MSTPHFSYEVLQLRPNQILVYTYWPDKRPRTGERILSSIKETEPNKKYTGKLSLSAKKKLRYAINLLVAQSKWKTAFNHELQKNFQFRINFITLTLSAPQGQISDKEIKRVCLNNFLNRAKKLWNMDCYVWRAEKQKNTNIHFHITTDTYIHYAELCKVWNECQELLGFVSRFRERTGSHQPNSTDIHAVRGIQNLANYITKYMSKGEKDLQTIDGKVWDCSRNLLQAKKFEIELYGKHFDHFKKMQELYPLDVFENDHCIIISLPEKEFKEAIKPVWGVEYENYLNSVKTKRIA